MSALKLLWKLRRSLPPLRGRLLAAHNQLSQNKEKRWREVSHLFEEKEEREEEVLEMAKPLWRKPGVHQLGELAQ